MDKKGGWKVRMTERVRKPKKSDSEGALSRASTPRPSPLGPLDNDTTAIPSQSSEKSGKTPVAVHVEVSTVDDPATPENPPQYQLSINDPYGDTARTLNRYKDAVERLREALKNVQGEGKLFQVPEFDTIPDDLGPIQLREAISHIFDQAATRVKNPSRWTKCKQVIEIMYLAISPFIKNILLIARDAQSVSPFRTCLIVVEPIWDFIWWTLRIDDGHFSLLRVC
jgi:hypothetical protein